LKAKGGFFFSSPTPDSRDHPRLKHILDPVNIRSISSCKGITEMIR
jgi:hypothetical protein